MLTSIYPNLDAELLKKGITMLDLAVKIHMSYYSLMCRMRGIHDITVFEARQIQKTIQSELPLEELFKTEG
jgi:hypothetical protein